MLAVVGAAHIREALRQAQVARVAVAVVGQLVLELLALPILVVVAALDQSTAQQNMQAQQAALAL